MSIKEPKHILIAPLDWGLGHTTRCIPIIRSVRELGHIPVIAGNASQRSYLEETLGPADFVDIEGYNITYSKWNRLAQIGLLSQLPHIHHSVSAEHKWLQHLARCRKIDGIISDNRYGLFHPGIPSVIVTHQLQVLSGLGHLPDRAIRRIHYRYLDRFHATWVPDAPGPENLGGILSHPDSLPRNAEYIGLLSRFEQKQGQQTPGDTIMILLSGPEPQRTQLSHLLWRQAVAYSGKVIFIEGSEQVKMPAVIPPHITYYRRVAGQQLAALMSETALVICRSGYSTLMDLTALGRKAILIPTPGQTEQQYLGKHLHNQGVFYSTAQPGFDINRALEEARQFPYRTNPLPDTFTSHRAIICDWLQKI